MSNMKTLDTSDLIPEEIAMAGRSYAHRWQTQAFNQRTYAYWVHRLRCVAMGAFKWEGFDSFEIDPRYIEYCLLETGMGAIFDFSGDRRSGLLAFGQAVPMSRLNMYWNPGRIRIMPANGGPGWTRHAYWWTKTVFGIGRRQLQSPDAVVLYDNINRQSILPIIQTFARRLENIDRKIDINLNAQATPFMMSVDEKQRRDAENMFAQITGNEPLIISNKSAASANLVPTVLSSQVPFVADKMQEEKTKILYEALTLLGVDNSNTEKKERLIDAEATANNEDIMLMRRSRLATRRQFCEDVNKLFGTQLSVNYGVPHVQEGDGPDVDMSGYDDDGGDDNAAKDPDNADSLRAQA